MSPRFGELLATDVWAAAARTLTDISIEELFDLPVVDDHYVSISPITSATADLFGSSVEISSDVGTGKRLLYVSMTQLNTTPNVNVQLEFGDAADGAGNVIARAHFGRVEAREGYTIPLYCNLPDNIALHVRAKDNPNSAQTYRLGVQIA